ncbi:MAG: putative Intraflagellar transport protein 57 [Streblomastix strix]|uniref:Putative Intraflagellar transport protein 57 n=1 Tax=Streblomastix strix TaxID=222440 RepID=A0A5J4X8S2_9EUKA|nr:MAG: putative Intraflagellar transport protein 57 [Streblomastix strix]
MDEIDGVGQDKRKKRDISDGKEGVSSIFLMGAALEKLKALNYDTQFCRTSGIKQFNCFYFAAPQRNPQEQFFHMCSLIEWLFKKCGQDLRMRPQLGDDENTSSATIVSQLRRIGYSQDITPVQIKQGYGDEVCQVINYLCDEALGRINFQSVQPDFPNDGQLDEIVEENRGNEDEEDDEEEDGLPEDDLVEDDDDPTNQLPPANVGGSSNNDALVGKKKKIIRGGFGTDEDEQGRGTNQGLAQSVRQSHLSYAPRSRFDPTQWQSEVERVAPQLKVRRPGIGLSQKDWFGHLEEIKDLLQKLSQSKRVVLNELNMVAKEIQSEMEKIESRERYFNEDCKQLLGEYKESAGQLKEVAVQVSDLGKEVDDMAAKLAETTDEVEQIKTEMENYGESVSNTKPLMRLKQSQSKLQDELKQINVRVGTLQHYLLQTQITELEEKKTTQGQPGGERSIASHVAQSDEADDEEEGSDYEY